MYYFIFLTIILELLVVVHGELSCYVGYSHCNGYIWCCPDGYVCTGSSSCLSIGTIVGAVIGALVGVAILIGCICFCCRQGANARGTVIQNTGGGQPVIYSTSMQQQQQPYTQPYNAQPAPGYQTAPGYQPNAGYQPDTGFQPTNYGKVA